MKRVYLSLIIAPIIILSLFGLRGTLFGEQVPTSVLSYESTFKNRVLIPAATTTPPLTHMAKVEFTSAPFPIEKTKVPEYSASNPRVTFESIYAILLKIARCESNNDPLAKNKTSSAKGLLQIIDGTWQSFKCEGHVLNPDDNMRCGVKIATQSGLHHWNESRSCWIKLVQTV